MSTTIRRCLAALALAVTAAAALAQTPDIAERVQNLEDKEAIRALLHAYGALLDQRDFAAFGRLFADPDGVYVGGLEPATGPAAIAASMERVFRDNPSGLRAPNFHLFFNETIAFDGDRATAFSQSAFVVPAENGGPELVFFASYDDELVREHGVWKFARRVVHGEIPAPRPR